jgi:hypothetical protein
MYSKHTFSALDKPHPKSLSRGEGLGLRADVRYKNKKNDSFLIEK